MRVRGLRAVLWAAALLAACASPYAERGARPHGETRTPIRDRYAGARLELLDAINADRAGHGLPPVALDSLASTVAQAHAEAMAAGGFFSHYGAAGDAPFERYAEAGGDGHVRENVFRHEERPARPGAPGGAWARFDPREAERWLMASPGHRATILDPARTGVGLGVAVDPSGRRVVVVQDFVARHAAITGGGVSWLRGPARIEGRVLSDGLRPLLVVLHRLESPPDWARRGEDPPGGPYADGADAATVLPPWAIAWNPTDRTFAFTVPSEGRPGRTYGIVYVAPEREVLEALASRSASTRRGWPGAAFVTGTRERRAHAGSHLKTGSRGVTSSGVGISTLSPPGWR